jgi:hypothetical protein
MQTHGVSPLQRILRFRHSWQALGMRQPAVGDFTVSAISERQESRYSDPKALALAFCIIPVGVACTVDMKLGVCFIRASSVYIRKEIT